MRKHFRRIVFCALVFQAVACARGSLSGYCTQGGQKITTNSIPSTTQVMQSYPQCSVTVFYTGGPVGTVTTSGTSVTWQSGTLFNANSGWAGLQITIASVSYTIQSVSSTTALTLTSSAGTQSTPVAYSMASTTPSAIYTSSGTASTNPFISSKTGYWQFYADNGKYDIQLSGGGIPVPFTWSNQSLIDPLSLPNTASDLVCTTSGCFATLCSTAASLRQTLLLSRMWDLNGTCAASIYAYTGGGFRPGSGHTTTLSGSFDGTLTQHFDISQGGSVQFTAPMPVVYPNWWGAIADGTGAAGTDQTAKIQAAVTALANGGTVFFPKAANCYTVTYPGIQVKSNIKIDGNPGSCVQNMHAAFSDWLGGFGMVSNSLSANTTGLNNVHVSNVTIDGNRANITGLTGSNLNALGVAFYGCSDCSVENTTVENAGDNFYIDCSDSGRLTQGNNAVASGNVFTNAQRNNVSVICGTNTQIINNEISFANGTAPQTGIDVEENVTGQGVPGTVIRGNRIHDNSNVGVIVQPAHDAVDTLGIQVQNNYIYNNVTPQVQATNFTTFHQTMNLDGNMVIGSAAVAFLVQGFAGSMAGNIGIGANVGASFAVGDNTGNMTLVGGYYSGGSYDIESDSFSHPIVSFPALAHGKVHGIEQFSGAFSPNGYNPVTSVGYGYIGQAYAPAGVTVANSDAIHVKAASIGSGGAITTQRGVHCDDLTAAGSNVCIQSDMTQGANKYNLYMSSTALNYLRTGFQALVVNFSTLIGLYPCNSTNYGHLAIINDAMSNTLGSVITGGGSFFGIAVCSSVSGSYEYH